jgi:hypothetical protein
MLLTKNEQGLMAWQCAAVNGNLGALERLLSWAKDADLNPDELLLAQIQKGFNLFQNAAEKNQIEVLNILWTWAEKGQMNGNELKNNYYYQKTA